MIFLRERKSIRNGILLVCSQTGYLRIKKQSVYTKIYLITMLSRIDAAGRVSLLQSVLIDVQHFLIYGYDLSPAQHLIIMSQLIHYLTRIF